MRVTKNKAHSLPLTLTLELKDVNLLFFTIDDSLVSSQSPNYLNIRTETQITR